MFSHVNHSKKETPVLGSSVPVLGMKLKRGWQVFWSFLKIDRCSATSMESSRRDVFNDMVGHSAILKNVQNTYYPVLVPHPEQVQHSPKRSFVFTVMGRSQDNFRII